MSLKPNTLIDQSSESMAEAVSTTVRRTHYNEVIKLALPAIAEQLLFTAVQMAALVIVGHLGAESIAAVGVSNQINWFFQSGYFALGTGTTTLVARFVGANERESVETTVKQALVVALLAATAVSTFGFVFAPQILSLMGTTAEVSRLAIPYLRFLFVAAVFSSISMCSSAALRGAGDTQTPMKVTSAGALLNIALMWLLVNGRFGLPNLGVSGAGASITISYTITSLFYLAVFLSRRFAVRLSLTRFAFDLVLIKRLLVIGVPAALEQLFMSGGMTIFAGLVISLGTVAYATHQVTTNITSVSYMTGYGLSMAATCLVGQNLGAKRPDLAEVYAMAARSIGFWAMSALGAIFFFLGGPIMSFYTKDAAIIASGAYVLRLAAFAQPPIGSYAILAGALRGAGDTKYPLYITFAGIWLVRLVVAYVLLTQVKMGLTGVWIAVNFDTWIRSLLVLLRFRTGKWKTLKV